MARRTSATRTSTAKRLPKATVPNPDAETITDPQTLEVTDEQTTQDPEGNEAVVEINGEATEPNSDPENDVLGEPSTVTPDPDKSAAAAEPGVVTPPPADPFVDPNPNDNLTDEEILKSDYRVYWQKVLDDSGVTPPVGRLLFPGEPLTFVGQKAQDGLLTLTEDIYRVVFPFRSLRPTFTLEMRAGRRISRLKTVTKSEYLRQTNKLIGD